MNKTPPFKIAYCLAALVVFVSYFVFLVRRVVDLLQLHFSAWVLLIILGLAAVAYFAADFVSGFVHFLADNFGSPTTPFFGPNFIAPFREHHTDPTGITRHSFIEVNGNNALISLPLLIPTYYGVAHWSGLASLIVGAWIISFLLWIALTNQFHKWAHTAVPPRWVERIQNTGLILSPSKHSIHHTSPFETYYCITSGILNPLLERTKFFDKLQERLKNILPGPNG